VAKADFDTVFDNIKTILETYSAAQPAAERFIVWPDRFRDLPTNDTVAHVIQHMGDISVDSQTTGGEMELSVKYHFDLLVRAKGTRTDGAYTERASQAAGVRIRYLVHQLLSALFAAGTYDLSLASGKIGSKEYTGFTPLFPEEIGERGLAAGRLTISVATEWTPTAAAGTAIDGISVTADKWSALIEEEE
jgi:hypothetical protein